MAPISSHQSTFNKKKMNSDIRPTLHQSSQPQHNLESHSRRGDSLLIPSITNQDVVPTAGKGSEDPIKVDTTPPGQSPRL
mmetsp:Transcript_31723/g.48626  ORF Transcript_31723/g.48626 Transcript_31723/m.48626 type:complete len:80 (+) Transcript_31723:3116-3355(+)